MVSIAAFRRPDGFPRSQEKELLPQQTSEPGFPLMTQMPSLFREVLGSRRRKEGRSWKWTFGERREVLQFYLLSTFNL